MRRFRIQVSSVLLAFCTQSAQSNLTNVASYKAINEVLSIDWSHNGRVLVFTTPFPSTEYIRSMLFTNDTLKTSDVRFVNFTKDVNSIRWHPVSNQFAVGRSDPDTNPEDLLVYHVNTNTGVMAFTNGVEENDSGVGVAWSRTPGHFLAIAKDTPNDGDVEVYAWTNNVLTSKATFNNNNSTAGLAHDSLDWHPGVLDLAVGVHDDQNPLIILRFSGSSLTQVNGAIPAIPLVGATGLDWAPTGSVLAVGLTEQPVIPSSDGGLRLYEYNTVTSGLAEQTNARLAFATSSVEAVQFDPTGQLLALGAGRELRVYRYDWPEETLALVASDTPTNALQMRALRWSPDGRYLATGDAGDWLRIYKLLYADVSVRKEVSGAAVGGGMLTYTVIVTNAGPFTATEVSVLDTMPTNLTVTSVTGTVGVVSNVGQLVYGSLGALASGAVAQVTIEATVGAAGFGAFTNRVAVSTTAIDLNLANDRVTRVSLEDSDGDGVADGVDNCPSVSNPVQENSDGDSHGDACDNCPVNNNEDQADGDADGVGNVCDNCVSDPNPLQLDPDFDGLGNECDNCDDVSNPAQTDTDGDLFGDACDTCPTNVNTGADQDGDGIDNACDPDIDGDGIPNDWEASYGLDSGSFVDGFFDPDGDTFLNWEEYWADTVPNPAIAGVTSYLRIATFSNQSSRVVGFQTSTARVYHVDYTTNLWLGTWFPLLTNIPGQVGGVEVTDGSPTPERHYRLRVNLPP